jgi:hypothetical protein
MLIGILLIGLGVAGLVARGFSFTRQDKKAEIGPIDISTEETERVRIHPAIGIVLLASGTALTIAAARGGRGRLAH